MNRTCIKRKNRNLHSKLLFPVLCLIAFVFIAFLIISIIYYKNTYYRHEIDNQREQLNKAVHAVSMIQTMTDNISKQIVVSEEVQNIPYQEKTPAEYFVTADKIQQMLRTYTFIMDYIKEIIIYTQDGDCYSSFSSRDKFEPDKQEWYTEFKKTNEGKGYTKVHQITTSQNGRKQKVLSYVLPYYAVTDYTQQLGNLIICLDYASIEKAAELDMSMLKGCAIFDKNGTKVFGEGKISLSYDELKYIDEGQFTDKKGNIYLVSGKLGSDWLMIVQISDKQMQKQILQIEVLIVFVFVMLAFFIILVLSHNIKKVVKPINSLSQAAEQFGNGNFDVSVEVHTGDEVEILGDTFNKMVQDVKYYTEMSVEHEKIIRRSQVDQLLLQINPHFIYNTLNSVVYMARLDGNREIEQFVNAFISLLQSTLRVEDKVYISLEEEIKNVENYLILQKYRYMDKFDETINCEEELKSYLVPKVILQPIVENAIFHGIAPKEGRGKLTISVSRSLEKLCIIVKDNGVGMSETMIMKLMNSEYADRGSMRKIGIANVYRRIKEICGEEYGFKIISKEGDGTSIVIELPLLKE
ncbi:MAG: histidine kinase [Eubacteriales bacterium]|nr:histidine kinase [Eubacteriales bacterium]